MIRCNLACRLCAIVALMLTLACGQRQAPASGNETGADSVAEVHAPTLEELTLPDTAYASAAAVVYLVEHEDTAREASLKYYDDLYEQQTNVLTFRKNLMRNANFGGTVEGTPDTIVTAWEFHTAYDTTHTRFGTWGGGTGWTGQPLYMKWSQEQVEQFRQQPAAQLTDDFGYEEIMVGSLCGYAYFINYATGKASREPLDLHNVVKGTMSLDPEQTNLYVGQGVPKGEPIGCQVFDLTKHERTFFFADSKAWRGWNAFDSSPIVAGGFLFWPGENGSLYKYERTKGELRRVSVMRYRVNGRAPGIESSICIYRNYGFFGDNHGNIICVNLNTMRPVWHYNNHDDSDGTIVCREEGGTPYLYAACEVDKQGDEGVSHFVKLNALNGELVWERPIACERIDLPGKTLDGGMYASPLIGTGDCDTLLFANVCRNGASRSGGELTALSTRDGSIVYTVPYGCFAWSSPVGFTNERSEMFIFTGDSNGRAYIIRGRNGEVLARKVVGYNFESSPCVVGNTAVVGCRGTNIYKFIIKQK